MAGGWRATARKPRPQNCAASHYISLANVCNAWHYTWVDIDNIRHKGLKRFVEKGDRRIAEPDRLADMIAFLNAAPDGEALRTAPNFGFHALQGNRRGRFAMTVTKNWRLTFALTPQSTIADMDLEDYHGN